MDMPPVSDTKLRCSAPLLTMRIARMTPDPTLTDEELAEIEAGYGVEGTMDFDPDVLRLIAALRASRADAERLRAEAREEYARAQQAETAMVAAKAEVERLRTSLDFYANPDNWASWTAAEAETVKDSGDRARRALNTPVAPPTLT